MLEIQKHWRLHHFSILISCTVPPFFSHPITGWVTANWFPFPLSSVCSFLSMLEFQIPPHPHPPENAHVCFQNTIHSFFTDLLRVWTSAAVFYVSTAHHGGIDKNQTREFKWPLRKCSINLGGVGRFKCTWCEINCIGVPAVTLRVLFAAGWRRWVAMSDKGTEAVTGKKKKKKPDERQTICAHDWILKAIFYRCYSTKLLLCIGRLFK